MKIRNLTAANKDYWHFNVFCNSFVWFFCYIIKYLTTKHIFFSTTKTPKTKFLSFCCTYESFFVMQQKFPINIRFLYITLFKHKQIESNMQSLLKLKLIVWVPFVYFIIPLKRRYNAGLWTVLFFSVTFTFVTFKRKLWIYYIA